MKKLVAIALTAALVGMGGAAEAAKVWDDMSWWGNTGATPLPHPDSQGRAGYWWWPTEPASNVNDQELWGNRGIVYHAWERPAPEPPAEPTPPPPPVPPTPAERQVPAYSHVLFDFDKSVLKPEGKQVVDQVIADLRTHPQDTVLIEGHTCNIGTADYNMGLGQRRANSVRDYMVQNGIDPGRVQTVSHGLTQPAVPNDTPANRALNRRVVFRITLGD